MTNPRVAIVVPNLQHGGGVSTVGAFLHAVINNSGKFTADFVSLAMSARDNASVRCLSPRSWPRGVRVDELAWKGEPIRHVGAYFAELEFQRYQPRRALTRLLNSYDIVQVVAGSPAWALTCKHVRRPVCLQVASIVEVERRARLASVQGPTGLLRRALTQVTTRLDEAALNFVDMVFVENAWMHERLRHQMRPDQVIFAPPGIDTDLFHPSSEGKCRDDFILSVGRFSDPRKNVRLLFQAYHLLRSSWSSAPRLVLAGKAQPTADDWEVAASLGLIEHIEVRGDVSVDELAELYRNAAVFVLSSDEEGLGMVILEAMASGIPIISTDCGGPSTAVIHGETGLLTPVRDQMALANAMRVILDDPSQAFRMGRAGRQRVEEQFSMGVSGRRFIDVYRQLLGM